jgi:hypothetical protein
MQHSIGAAIFAEGLDNIWLFGRPSRHLIAQIRALDCALHIAMELR